MVIAAVVTAATEMPCCLLEARTVTGTIAFDLLESVILTTAVLMSVLCPEDSTQFWVVPVIDVVTGPTAQATLVAGALDVIDMCV